MNVSLWWAMPRFSVMLPRVCAWLCLIDRFGNTGPTKYMETLTGIPIQIAHWGKIEELFHSLWLASLFRFSGVHIVCSGDIRDFGLFQPAYYCSACVDIADRHISSTKGRNISRSVSIYVICCTISNTNVLKSSIRFDDIWWFVCKDGKS